ncbi:hypothetical protein J2X68_007953 [Streptomyces sp. 3330]|nr:hypothetical protein [Streptomyces sp. 3330]
MFETLASPPVSAAPTTDTELAGTPEPVDSAVRAPDEAPSAAQVPPVEDNTTDTAADLLDLSDLDPLPPDPPFILYKAGAEFDSAVADLTMWVHGLLLPVYGREVSSMAPWCTRWWEHLEVVAQLYGLWMAWQELTGSKAPLTGPAAWHRDYLMPVMASLRDPSGPFAGCKPGQHRAKEPPPTGEP